MEYNDRSNVDEKPTEQNNATGPNAPTTNDETSADPNGAPTPNNETSANQTDAARQTNQTTRNDLTDEDFENFEDWEDDYETFAEKLKKIPAFFSWNGKTSVREFAVATGGIFGAALLFGLFVACANFYQTNLLGVLGVFGLIVAAFAFVAVSIRRYRDAGLFSWNGETTRKEFFLAALKNVGKSLAWLVVLFLALGAIACADDADDAFLPVWLFGTGGCFGLVLSAFGTLGATLANATKATRYFRSANSFSWLGRATRKEFSFALADYCVATFATAFSFAFASLIWACAFYAFFQEDELSALGLIAFVFYFVVASLIFSPVLFAASTRRFRELGLDPRATLLYLVVPAPYMALILIALGPAPLDKETPNDEENEVAPNADESEKTTSKAEENADA